MKYFLYGYKEGFYGNYIFIREGENFDDLIGKQRLRKGEFGVYITQEMFDFLKKIAVGNTIGGWIVVV